MTDVALPDRVNAKLLTPIVRTATSLPEAVIFGWKSRALQGGSVGDVHLIEGTATPSPRDGRVMDWRVVLKVQRQWERPGDPESWRRELLMYESGLLDEVGHALPAPKLLLAETHDNESWLWLEHVGRGTDGGGTDGSVTGESMTIEQYRQAAADLGRMQGAYLAGRDIPAYPWLSSRWWVSTSVGIWGMQAVHGLGRNGHGERPHGGLPHDLSRATMLLWGQRDRALDALGTFPLTLCHRDYNAGNLFVGPDAGGRPTTIALDWDCAGIGTIAEDIGDMVGEAVVYFGYDPAELGELARTALGAYVDGLREVGSTGSMGVAGRAFATVAPLQWCFRVACLAQRTDDPDLLDRYAVIQGFMLGLAKKALG